MDYAQALAAAREREDAFVWLGLHEPDLADLTDIAATFGLDEFAVEDAVKAEQRPKIEQYGEMTFLVVRTARYVRARRADRDQRDRRDRRADDVHRPALRDHRPPR